MLRLTRKRLRRIGSALLPVAVGLFLALVALDENATPTDVAPLVGSLVAAAIGSIALYWRRTQPERATAVVLAAGLAFQILTPEIVLPIAGYFAVGSLAAARPPRVSLVGLVALVGLTLLNAFTTTADDTAFAAATAVGAWALGEVRRNRRAAIEEGSRRAVTEEQARIARELHDVIAHSVSVIVVQAAAADDAFDRRPEEARAALRSIEASGRDAMAELRRLLAGVRPLDEGTPVGPQPGLERLDELAEPLRAAGLEVEVVREGAPVPLPTGVDLSAFRIAQEALTNTLRHARASRARVTVTYGADAVVLDVRDDGRAEVEANGAGHGLMGMRERAALLGGTLEAGPQPDGGYRVHARLPLEAAP